MRTWIITSIIIVLILLAVVPAATYFIKFSGAGLSKDNLDWAQFGTYLSGTLTPVIALTAAVLTFTLGLISHRHNQTLLSRQEREKRPLANVGYEDRDEKIIINLHNKGLGPLLITKYIIKNTATSEERSSVFDWINCLPCTYGNYTSNLDNHVLTNNGKINLIRLQGDPADNDFVKQRERLRAILGELEIIVDYKDIYDNPMPTYKRSLKWFSRHLESVSKT